jgi:CRP/FNR family transcriptional regulator, cyclic AMP receptor protein
MVLSDSPPREFSAWHRRFSRPEAAKPLDFRPVARRDAFIEHLQQVPLFAACSRKDLQLVARRAEDVKVPAGKALVSEGETGQEFFVIIEGTARVTRQGRKIATIGPGQAFGELALLDKAPRNASVIADTDMELVVLGQREFAGIIDDVPGFARKLLAGMAHRLREADARSVQ